jgi:hypothetical protein
VLPSDQFVADTTATLQGSAVANGNGSTLTTGGLSAVMLTVNCVTCSGGTTINFEGTEDSTNYTALQAQQLGTNTIATSTATSGLTEWQIPVGGVQNIRARISGYSAGTVTVTGHASSADFAPKVTNTNVVSVPSNQSVNVAQVNGSTIATAATGIAKVGLTDGSTGTAITQTGGALDINIKSGGGSGGTALADEATFTQATTSFTPMGGIFSSAIANLTTGQAGVAQLTADRMLYTNLGKVGGTAVDTNSGNKSAGTQRVVIATDQPNLTTPLNVNTTQISGSAISTAATGVQKVGVVGNAGGAVDAATGAAPPANALYIAGLKSGATGGFLTGITACDLDANVNISTATTTLLITGVSGRQARICSINLVNAAADNVAIIEGTGATCGTGSAGMAGGTTAASGWNFAANGGLTQGTGIGEVMTTATTGDSVCLVTSAATQLSGHIKYTIY